MAKKRKNKPLDRDEEQYQHSKKPRVSETPLPEGVHHYETVEEVPWDLQKYWQQGYSIFSKYDDGVWMTDDAWFGVTHESVAKYVSSDVVLYDGEADLRSTIARHVAEPVPESKSIIIDAFCGVGGNTIAFALSGKWKRVYAIEKDAATLACAKHNAEIYGVSDKITWFHGDCFEILGVVQKEKVTVDALKAIAGQFGVIFASPPWGGPGYRDAEIFDLESMEPYSFRYLYESFKKVTSDMILYLPRTSDLRQIAQTIDCSKNINSKTEVVHYCTNGSSRALCAYIGTWSQVEK